MNLKESLRRERARGQEKLPLPPALFSHIGGLVRRYNLGEHFAQLMASFTGTGASLLARRLQAELKPPYEVPLFFLATPAEYHLIQRLITALDNPYLAHAHSPEEILLSRPLWQRQPGLAPELLASRHLAALW
jgi:hypothetical protein